MTVQTRFLGSTVYLAQKIKLNIKRKTGVAIRELFVEVTDEEVVLFGYTNAYYNKQLVSHVVMGMIKELTLLNKIEVE